MQTPLPEPHYWQWKRHHFRKVWHMTCIRMGMFLIMREEECAKWKVDCCTSKRVILKGNVGVKGKVIPCMLSLIKYVAQRKCALLYSLVRPPLATNQVVHVSMHIEVKNPKMCKLASLKSNSSEGGLIYKTILLLSFFPWPWPPWDCRLFFLSDEQIHTLSCLAQPSLPLL